MYASYRPFSITVGRATIAERNISTVPSGFVGSNGIKAIPYCLGPYGTI